MHTVEKEKIKALKQFWVDNEDFNECADSDVNIGDYRVVVQYDTDCDSDYFEHLRPVGLSMPRSRGIRDFGKVQHIASIDEVILSEFKDGAQNWNVTKFKNQFWFLPVYVLDHSGVAYSSTPFNCPWDSGLAGLIYISKKDFLALKFPWVKSKTPAYEKRLAAEALLREELQDFNDHCNGNYFNITVSGTTQSDDDSELYESYGLLGERGLVSGLESALSFISEQTKLKTNQA